MSRPHSPIDCLFIHTPQESSRGDAFIMFMAMGIFALADRLQRRGYRTKILHLGVEKIADPEFTLAGFCRDKKIACAAISLHWHYQSDSCMALARELKGISPDTKTVFGGFTASFFANDIIRNPAVDFIIRGDGEIPLEKLMPHLEGDQDQLAKIPNLSWQRKGKPVHNPLTYTAGTQELDQLNFSNVRLMENFTIYSRVPLSMSEYSLDQLNDYSTFFLCAGRGCPVNCTYCGGSNLSQRNINARIQYSFRSCGKILETIKEVITQGIEHLYLSFDPSRDKTFYIELFRSIRHHGLVTSMTFECWSLPSHAFINAFAQTFGQGPHTCLVFSPETGSEALRKRHKGFFYTNQAFFDTLYYAHKKGLKTDIFFSHSLPGESKDTVRETSDFMERIRKFNGNLTIYTQGYDLDPGCPLYEDPDRFDIHIGANHFDDYCLTDNQMPKYHFKKDGRPRPISIWHPISGKDGLTFLRPDPLVWDDHFARQPILRAKKTPGKKRICFFGESVAAGYLYAPQITPAEILEKQLNTLSKAQGYEVIDLARTNETLDSLVTTMDSSLQLNPDMLVVFMGNNWTLLETPEISPYPPSQKERKRIGNALRTKGLLGVAELSAYAMLSKAVNSLEKIAKISKAAKIPVLLVIPEINRMDWENRQPAPWLPGGNLGKWYQHYWRALEYLKKEQWEKARLAALGMLELDEWSSPTAYRILARAFLGEGETRKALESFKAEVDNGYYATLCLLGAPQINTLGLEVLRQTRTTHGFTCVDLPLVFAQYSGSNIQGRRLFLDYCHLTLEGMKIAMGAVTHEILELFNPTGSAEKWQVLLPRLPDPKVAAHADATAKFGAAIHNAHRMISLDAKGSILEYWCDQALETDPTVAQTMVDYIDGRSPSCPTVFSKAQQRNCKSPHCLSLQHGWKYDFIDADLTIAILNSLKKRGLKQENQIISLLLAKHGRQKETNLIFPPFYLWEPLERFYPELMPEAGIPGHTFHRSPWPTTSFCLICSSEQQVELELTLRLPPGNGIPKTGSTLVDITVNGDPAGSIALTGHFQKHTLGLSGQILKTGLNRLILHWPMPAINGTKALAGVMQRLEQGLTADLYPVFGEIFSLKVRRQENS
jgi:radical SAM superfamily enzyme YgiQ (UPF0313 family)